jgi:hypothetical protein
LISVSCTRHCPGSKAALGLRPSATTFGDTREISSPASRSRLRHQPDSQLSA